MKLGFVHLNLATESGDTRMFFHIAQNLKSLGHEVKIFTAQFRNECFPELNKGLDIIVVPPKESLGVETKITGVISKIKDRLVRERRGTAAALGILAKLSNDADVLICQNDQSYKLGVFYKKKNPQARVVWIMNNAPFRHTKKANPLVNMLSIIAASYEKIRVRRFLRGIDEIIVNDNEQKELLKSLGREARLLPVPVDFEKFYAPPKNITSDSEAVLLGIGALSPARKFEDIIAAAGILLKNGRAARVILVCKDFWKDVTYRKLLENAAKEAGLDGRAEFLFEGATEDELHEILRRAHVYVFPNHIKIGSMSSFEAMAAGLALVVSDITSVAEVLKDGENALFVRPGHPEEIAGQIEKIFRNPELYKKIAEAGQEFVKENLSWQKYALELVSFLKPS